MFAGLAFVLSSGGYGWPMNANDFSRYLPHDVSRKRIVASVAIGGFVPATLLLLLGAAVATGTAAASGATTMTSAFSGWFAWPYLIFVILQVFCINSIDLYSSGLTLQSIMPKIKRFQCVLLDTVIAGALTAWVVFSSSFDTFVNDFVLFMLIWLGPWVAILHHRLLPASRPLRLGCAATHRRRALLPQRRHQLARRDPDADRA